jgi:hypothetical protein
MTTIFRGVEDVLSSTFNIRNEQELAFMSRSVRDVVEMARLTRTDVNNHEDMYYLALERGLTYDSNMVPLYDAVLEVNDYIRVRPEHRNKYALSPLAGQIVSALENQTWYGKPKNMVPSKAQIDFTDMVELAIPLAGKERVGLIFWDEVQDANRLYFDYVLSKLTEDGRLVAVGDDKQNIMGWAGAFLTGMQVVVEEMDALELPLDVTMRCPISHVELADMVFPGQTQPAPWADDGTVSWGRLFRADSAYPQHLRG